MNLEPSLLVLWDDLHEVHVLWQVGILAVSLGIAWWASRQLPQLGGPILKWKASAGGFKRVRFPLIALALVLIGRAILRNYHSVGLLTVAVPLLIALAISRAVVYMLRLTFPASGVLSASERLIAWLIWIGVALHLTGLAPELLDFLEGATFPLGKQHVSLLTVIQGLLSVCVALLVSLWLSRVLEDRVMKVAGVQMNLRVMLTKVLRPLLVLIGLLIALPAVGIDLTALSVFGGALGVGIGFGLQRIASNYISGFLILLDRSLSIGDLVTIDNHTGQVARLTARYVVVRKLDGTEVLVPNEFVITSTVVNRPERARPAAGADQLRQRPRCRAAADGRGGARPTARARGSRAGSADHGIRRQRHQPRTRRLDQRPGSRQGGSDFRDLLRYLEEIPHPRHRNPVPAARSAALEFRPRRPNQLITRKKNIILPSVVKLDRLLALFL